VAGEGSGVTRFSPVSSAALDDTRLTGPDILVLAALGYHTDKTGWCWPSQDTIATRARLTRQTVSECMKRLVSFGHVERYIPDDGNLAKIRYRPVLDASSAPEVEQTQPVGLVGVTDKGGVALTDTPLSAETTSLVSLPDKACRPNRHKQEPSNKSKEQDNTEALFLEIWAPWERNWSKAKISRRGDGKAKTFEQFTRKARTTDAAVIRSSALSFLAKADPQFLPGLSVWLNREGWDTGNVVAIEEVPRERVNRYGVIDVERDMGHLVSVKGLVEKPPIDKAPSNLTIIGRYVLMPEVIGHLAKGERGAGGDGSEPPGPLQGERESGRGGRVWDH
jgi:hypothetical protein